MGLALPSNAASEYNQISSLLASISARYPPLGTPSKLHDGQRTTMFCPDPLTECGPLQNKNTASATPTIAIKLKSRDFIVVSRFANAYCVFNLSSMSRQLCDLELRRSRCAKHLPAVDLLRSGKCTAAARRPSLFLFRGKTLLSGMLTKAQSKNHGWSHAPFSVNSAGVFRQLTLISQVIDFASTATFHLWRHARIQLAAQIAKTSHAFTWRHQDDSAR